MFDNDEDEENFLDDILKKAYEEEEADAEKERIRNLLHRNASIFYDEISKDEKILVRDASLGEEKKKKLLENMLNLFIEFEEYEKCAKVHQWQEMIKNPDDAQHTSRKSRKV